MSTEHTDDTTHMKQLFIRVPDSLIAAIDRYEKRLAAEQPWMPISRSVAVRRLLHKALEVIAAEDAGGVRHTSSTAEVPRQEPHFSPEDEVSPPISTPPSPATPPPSGQQQRTRTARRQRILECIRAHGGPMTVSEAEAALPDEAPLKDSLQKMAKSNLLIRVGPSRYDVPDRVGAVRIS